jgi:hypothetical protein
LTNFHKIDIFQSAVNNPLGGGAAISSFPGAKSPESKANLLEIWGKFLKLTS